MRGGGGQRCAGRLEGAGKGLGRGCVGAMADTLQRHFDAGHLAREEKVCKRTAGAGKASGAYFFFIFFFNSRPEKKR